MPQSIRVWNLKLCHPIIDQRITRKKKREQEKLIRGIFIYNMLSLAV